jgi:hypothetical protein
MQKMSGQGGGGGIIIIGDELLEKIKDNLSLLPALEQTQFNAIYEEYHEDESSVTTAQEIFVLDCAKQLVRALNK